MSLKESCDVCCENFDLVAHTRIICGNTDCSLAICSVCYQKVLLVGEDAVCCGCRSPISLMEIKRNATKGFMLEFYRSKLAREEIIDRSKIKTTMLTLASIKKKEEIDKNIIRITIEIKQNEIAILRLSILKIDAKSLASVGNKRDSLKEILGNWRLLVAKSRDLNKKKEFMKRTMFVVDDSAAATTSHVVAMNCGYPDCNGVLLDEEEEECPRCKNLTCHDCGTLKKTEETLHVCRQDDIESHIFRNTETRPCPKCVATINKIDGCDQMWCPICKTVFSWSTGQLDTGKIHNPHYYEHARVNGGLDPDNADVWNLTIESDPEYINAMFNQQNTVMSFIGKFRRTVRDINYHLNVVIVHMEENDRELNRMKLINEKISPAVYKTNLRKCIKSEVINIEYKRNLALLRDSIGNVFLKTTIHHENITDYGVEGIREIAMFLDRMKQCSMSSDVKKSHFDRFISTIRTNFREELDLISST